MIFLYETAATKCCWYITLLHFHFSPRMAKFFNSPNTPSMASVIMLLLGLLMATLHTRSAEIGVCYGMVGDNLPSKPDVIALYNQNNIRRMRLYDPNREALEAFRGSNFEVMPGLPNDDLRRISSTQAEANTWVQENVQNFVNNVKFKCIAVGNEAKPGDDFAQYLVPTMRNIQNAIDGANLGTIPSLTKTILDPLITFLNKNNSPLLVTVIYLLILHYLGQNNRLFLTLPGGGSLDIVISESGWPAAGGDGALTNVDNAKTYNNNLIQHVKQGSPKKPRPIETYIFAIFDENG
ncbi:putative glucan endo-1,3-beta-glucosidase BG3 [Citrus sinensis]|uniref:Glucan endo-1,3-beta-glucosidase BG3 n=1 Tax=Citrus sinensis TaxID=2711 RepID=A0ACB8HXT0_CITSI|nr:putative glucan endo-1,3-beta-glucosidase BG3 [Citrus sinensis]